MIFQVSRTSIDSDEMPFPFAKRIDGKWTVEFDTLSDLVDFINDYDKVIINTNPMHLEIYDDYRE